MVEAEFSQLQPSRIVEICQERELPLLALKTYLVHTDWKGTGQEIENASLHILNQLRIIVEGCHPKDKANAKSWPQNCIDQL